MGKHAKRILSWALALALLTTCVISGLVLPTAAADENLVVNGDFEQGASVSWGNSAYVMEGVGVNGSMGYKIESTVNEGDSAKTLGAYYMGDFNSLLEPNTTYIVSFDYKTEGKGFGRFQVIAGSAGSDWVGWTAKSNLTATEWTTVTFEFTTGAAENMKANKGWEWKLERIHYANAAGYGTGATYYDNIRVIKKPTAATAIALDKSAATVKVGQTTTLTATAAPEGASLPAITWKSSNEAVATVANGVVTGVAEGTATITATAEGLAPVTCTVTVKFDNNLFPNGDFEGFAEATPVVAPWSYVSNGGSQMNTAAVTAGVGVDGSYGLKLGTTKGAVYVAFPNKVALEEGATYRLSWMAKSGTVSKAAVVMLNSAPNTTVTNSSLGSVYTKLSPTAGEWISYYMDIKANAGAYIHDVGGILIDVKAVDSSIVFDNFALNKIDEKADLILDGDFEKGADASLYAETLGGSYVLLSNANKAEIATAATADNANNRAMKLKGGAAWTGGYFNGSHFVGGESYKVSFDYKGGEFRFYANSATHGSFNDNNANVITYAAADEWKTGEFVFNFLESGSNNWAFSFEKKTANTADTYIDNLKIVKIVEEAPVATEIALDKATAEIDVAGTVTLNVTAKPDGVAVPAITWTTSDAAVATVADGVVTGVAAGTATITATADGLAPVTCTVTVKAPVTDGNILVNGDFEQGASVNWDNSTNVKDGVGKDGGKGLKIETTMTESGSSITTGTYYKGNCNSLLKPNTTYVFSFDYKNEGKGWGRFYVAGNTYGSDWTGWATKTNMSATEWTTVTIEFTTGAAENMKFNKGWEWKLERVHYSGANYVGTGATYYDNIKLVEKVVVAPTEIQVSPDKAKLEVGAEATLNVTVLPEGAEKPEIVWTTSDANIVKVENGKITAVAAGTAIITAKAGELTDTCEVTVIEDDGNLLVNGDLELGASVAWGNSNYVVNGAGKDGGYGLKIETEVVEGGPSVWPGPYYKGEFNSLLKPNTQYVFSFDYKMEGKGFSRVNVLKAGSDWTGWKTVANLTATEWTTVTVEFTTGAAENMVTNTGWEWAADHVQYASTPGTGVGYFDNFKLVEKVVIAPTEIQVSPDKAKLEVGAEATLNVTVLPADAEKPEITWTSSNADVVKVENGKITAVAAGTAIITAKAGELTDTCEVTVIEDDGNMIENGDLELGASVAWGNSKFVVNGAGKDGGYGLKIETSVAEGGASVWPGPYYKGEFNALLKPNTKYVFSFDYKVEGKGFSRLNVLKKGSDWTGWATLSNLTATEWTTVTMEFATGAEANMAAQTGWEWTAEHVQYSSTPGTGVGYFDNFKLVEKVVVPATGITLDKTAATLKPEQTTNLLVTAQPENAEPPILTWKSSDENVATVDQLGKVTAVAAGTATITVTTNNNLTATCVVTVKADDGNMIINGDFTNGTDAWGRNETEKGRIEAEAGKEGAGIKLHTNVTETTTAHQTPGVYYMDKFIALLEPDTIYTLSFDYKHEGLGFGQIVFNISPGKLENGAELKNIALANGNVDWTTKTYTFSTPSAMPNANTTWEWQVRQVQYYNQGQGSGTTWFDNFKLVEVGKVVHADSIAIAPDTLELFPNDSGLLAVTTSPIGASTGVVTWTSSDPTIVEVDQKGNVKALKSEGEVTITATNDKGKTATAKVVITEYADIIVNGDFEQGGTAWGNIANVKPGIGKDGSYGIELTNESDSWTSYYYKGSLAGKMQPATTYIMSVDYYAPSNTSSVRMWSYKLGMTVSAGSFKTGKNEWQTVTKIFTTPTDMALNAGWDLSFVCEETGGKPVVFDNFSIKKYSSGKEAESIVLNLDKMTIIPGRTGALTAHATPVDADLNDMTWTTSNANVAIVEYGVVTGVGKGTAVITGTTKNGKSASCTVTVSGNDVLVLNGNFDTEDDVWVLEGGATIAEGEGRVSSDGAAIVKDSTVKQTFKGLKADTQYQLFVSYRTTSGKAAIKLQNGETALVEGETGTSSLWSKLTFEFKTGETVEEDTVLSFTGLGNGPIYIDNVILSVKASLIDFTVNDIIWVGGGNQVKPGTELTFAVTVTNVGVDPVLAGQVIVVDLCKNGEVFQTLEYTCDTAITTNDSVIVMATAPWAAVKGDWVVSARANPTLSILELDDTNNTKQVNLRVNETILEAPKEAAAMDMTELTFSDEFDSYDSIDMYATGKDGYKWYVTRSWGAGTVQPDSYTVKDGIISLHDQKPVFNITMGTVDAVTGVGWDYRFGYLETRLRIVYPNRHEYAEGMSGGIPAIWSFPTDKWLERPGKNRQWVEMDWLEYWGRDLDRWPHYPDGYYTVTLHDQLQNDAGEQESWKVNSNSYQNGLGDGEWHVMGWLWAYNGVIAYIDGEEVFRIAYSEDGTPSCKVRTNAGDMFNDIGAFSYMNQQDLCLYIAGAYDKPLELDYVHIWQGGNAEVEAPDEEGDEGGEGEVIIDIEAEDFWGNFCTDDYGDPIMTIDEYNYRYILAGAEYWDLLSEERQTEINAILEAAGQPSFEELMAAVEEFLAENPEAMAQAFFEQFFVDEEGNLITEVTADNYQQILMSAELFMTLDADTQLAIIALMADYGMPAYEEIVEAALAIAEAEGNDDFDLGDFEIPETGATSAWPMAAVLLILVSAAALWFSRKRKVN